MRIRALRDFEYMEGSDVVAPGPTQKALQRTEGSKDYCNFLSTISGTESVINVQERRLNFPA